MAKKKQRKRTTKRRKKKQQISEHIIGLILSVISLFGIFRLGYLGILIANAFRLLIGNAYQIGTITLLLLGVYLMIYGKEPQIKVRYWGSYILILLGICLGLEGIFFYKLDLHSNFIQNTWQYILNDIVNASVANSVGGGIIGAFLYNIIYFLLSEVGVYLISAILIILGICMLFNISIQEIAQTVGKFCLSVGNIILWVGKKIKLGYKELIKSFKSKNAKIEEKEDSTIIENIDNEEEKQINEEKLISPEDKELPQPIADSTEQEILTDVWDKKDSKSEENNESNVESSHRQLENYELPSLDLLKDVPPTDQSQERKDIKRNQEILKQTLKSFGVDAELKNTILGPSVTKYELHPEIGVKVSKIVNLTDDLALALAAKDIRIEAPIPGKSLIGIEVPNKKVATISFKDVISAEQRSSHHLLEVPLGRDVSGKLITLDITKTPHLLIAGATGSGKSVAINGIITSLLMNCTPDDVKLMLVDPKKVELGVYNGIPHLISPVVTESKKAALSLNKLVAEMERRYETFANVGVRNIDGYNRLIINQQKDMNTSEKKMPYIVGIVDELADLMMVSSNEVESAIIRIAQMGRAAGIHMIIATQRPSVDVITGLIKANVPSRMAFAVSSGTDSRTILDQNGAEKLLGRGDMLFKLVGKKPIRVQGAYISDEDVENVVSFVKEQGTAEYDDNLAVSDEEVEQSQTSTSDSDDPLFNEVIDFIQREQKVSISLLQRKFKIGYNRAARIVDDLADKGMVGPQEGGKPRKVFLPKKED